MIATLVPSGDEPNKSMPIDGFCLTEGFTPLPQGSCGNRSLCSSRLPKELVALGSYFKLTGTCLLEHLEFFYSSHVLCQRSGYGNFFLPKQGVKHVNGQINELLVWSKQADHRFSQIEHAPGFAIPPQQGPGCQGNSGGGCAREQMDAGLAKSDIGCCLLVIKKHLHMLRVGEWALREVYMQLIGCNEKVEVISAPLR